MNRPDHLASKSYHVIRNTSLVLAISNATLAILQIIVAYWSSSFALLADSFHTFSDLIIDIVVYYAGLLGSQPPDKTHPYGYRRIETITSIVLSLVLCFLAVWILYSAWFIPPDNHIVDSKYVVFAALVSIIFNESLYQFTYRQAQSIHSKLLLASATHQRSDAMTSVVVLLSATLDLLGVNINMDLYGAIIIGLVILKMGLTITFDGVFELIDSGMSQKELSEIKKSIYDFEGINDLHMLRSRKMAGDIYMDLHVITDSRITVSEGHYIGERLRYALLEKYHRVTDITLHIDPEDDEDYHDDPIILPPRSTILADLSASGLLLDDVQKADAAFDVVVDSAIVIHYLKQKVYLELPIIDWVSKSDPQKQITLLKQYEAQLLQMLQSHHASYGGVRFFRKF